MLCKRIFSVVIITSSISAMNNPPMLVPDLIRTLAGVVLRASDWTESTKVFALKSMAVVNKQWLGALRHLSVQDFPYQFGQTAI